MKKLFYRKLFYRLILFWSFQLVLVLSPTFALSRQPDTVGINEIAPDFSLTDIEGHSVRLSDYRGTVVFLYFWASWCGNCKKEIPDLKKLTSEYANEKVVFLFVSLDFNVQKWIDGLKNFSIPGIHAGTLKEAYSEIKNKFNIMGVPTSYLINPEGKIIGIDLKGEILHNEIQKILTL